jgi:hypothetical protein
MTSGWPSFEKLIVGFLKDFLKVVDVIKLLNLSRIDKSTPPLLQLFDFSTLYSKIDLSVLKSRRKVLVNEVLIECVSPIVSVFVASEVSP